MFPSVKIPLKLQKLNADMPSKNEDIAPPNSHAQNKNDDVQNNAENDVNKNDVNKNDAENAANALASSKNVQKNKSSILNARKKILIFLYSMFYTIDISVTIYCLNINYSPHIILYFLLMLIGYIFLLINNQIHSKNSTFNISLIALLDVSTRIIPMWMIQSYINQTMHILILRSVASLISILPILYIYMFLKTSKHMAFISIIGFIYRTFIVYIIFSKHPQKIFILFMVFHIFLGLAQAINEQYSIPFKLYPITLEYFVRYYMGKFVIYPVTNVFVSLSHDNNKWWNLINQCVYALEGICVGYYSLEYSLVWPELIISSSICFLLYHFLFIK